MPFFWGLRLYTLVAVYHVPKETLLCIYKTTRYHIQKTDKEKFNLKQAMKAQRRSRDIALLFLSHWCSMVWVVNSIAWLLCTL
jgi:hypothetical protein